MFTSATLRTLSILTLSLLFVFSAPASNLEELTVLTNKYLLLHTDDGEIEYFYKTQDDILRDNNIDYSLALETGTYTITSDDDENYAGGEHPISISRKTKPSDFTHIWPDHPHSRVNWFYLELPHELQYGKTYTITLGGLFENTDTVRITRNEADNRSEAVHVNMIGYVPEAGLKYAYVYQWMGDGGPLPLDEYAGNPFHVFDVATGDTVVSGTTELRKDLESGEPDTFQPKEKANNYAMADVYECDFSSLTTEGEYIVAVEGVGSSFPFRIDPKIYSELFYLNARGLFHHRSGPARGEPHTKFIKPVDHTPGVNGFEVIYSTWRYMDGKDSDGIENLPLTTTEWNMPNNQAPWMGEDWGWGGYFDAADYDRRTNHFRVNFELLLVYELAPEKFFDGQLEIPESGNSIPDIIDEARWNIDFFRKMYGPTGGISGGIERRPPEAGYGSWNDSFKTWYAYAEEPHATILTATACAQLVYCLEIAGNTDEKDELIAQAEELYAWAVNPENQQDGDAEYIADEQVHALAWLYKVTGKEEYHTAFKEMNKITSSDTPLSVSGDGGYNQEWSTWTYITTDQPGVDASLQQTLTEAALKWAHDVGVNPAKIRANRMAGDMYVPTVVGLQFDTPMVVPLIFAHAVTGGQEYLDYIYTSFDYSLGGNPLNTTYTTGLEKYGSERNVTELMNIDSWHDGIDEYIPGITIYGPIAPYLASTPQGPWGAMFYYERVYPQDLAEWPLHELFFDTPYCPIMAEYTVQQNIGPMAAATAYLNDRTQISSVNKTSSAVPSDFKLYQNYPNPFNPSTVIEYEVARAGNVNLEIYDTLGRRVATLESGHREPGSYIAVWSGKNAQGVSVASGMYLIRMTVDNDQTAALTRKMMLIR